MLIDWLSIALPVSECLQDMVKQWQMHQDHIIKISADGEKEWEIAAWESVRSDSHQLAFQVTGSFIRIQGSPARIIADGDNVFSAGAAAALDLAGCLNVMVRFIAQHTGLDLPLHPSKWKLSRVDVTENLFVGSLPVVRQALSILRDCEGGRYRVSQQAGDSVYWSHRSRLRAGKAYAKGAELAHKMIKAGKQKILQPMRQYTIDEIAMASGLLRLELKLGAQYWRERIAQPWHKTTPDQLKHEWESYFSRMIGGAEMTDDDDIYDRILNVVTLTKAPKKGMYWVGQPMQTQAKAAYSLWNLIKSEGWEKAKDRTTKTTWYRNLAFLRAAGLSDADISRGNIVPLRRKIMEATPVTNWAELRTLFYQQAA